MARLQSQHQAVAPLDARFLQDRLGRLLEHGGVRGVCKRIIVDRFGNRAMSRQALRAEAIDLCLVGAYQQSSVGDGQPLGRPVDLSGPDDLARGRFHGNHLAGSAGKQHVAGQNQGVGTAASGPPADGRFLLAAPSFPSYGHQLRVACQVGRISSHDHLPPGELCKPVAGLAAKGDHFLGARIDVLAGQQGIGSADLLAEGGVVDEASGASIEGGGRDAAHGNVEVRLRGQQVSLG